MIELNFNAYKVAESFFIHKKQCIPALSVIHGYYPGRVFVDDQQQPSLAIVWATGRWMYLEGNLLADPNKWDVSSFLQDIVMPDCRERNQNWFEIYTADVEIWDQLFLKETGLLKGNKHYESVYTLNLDRFYQVRKSCTPPLDGIQINSKEFPILPEAFHNLSYVRDEFKTKKTAGVEIKKDNQLLSICRNNGFTYGDAYFIDVDTFAEEERGKGYATLAAIQLIELLMESGMFPLWETTHQNIPSHKLALKLGFEVKENYPVYAFMLC